jgi:hypothetical protein
VIWGARNLRQRTLEPSKPAREFSAIDATPRHAWDGRQKNGR